MALIPVFRQQQNQTLSLGHQRQYRLFHLDHALLRLRQPLERYQVIAHRLLQELRQSLHQIHILLVYNQYLSQFDEQFFGYLHKLL